MFNQCSINYKNSPTNILYRPKMEFKLIIHTIFFIHNFSTQLIENKLNQYLLALKYTLSSFYKVSCPYA